MAEQPGDTEQPCAGQVRDEVDDLVAAWRAERPDLDVQPLQVLSRISRLARHLDRARRTAFSACGLEPWQFDVLSALRRQGPPYQLSPGALVRATLVTSGTMTNRIDGLVAAGLVRRHPDPQDKRGVLVALTAEGRGRVDAALADLLGREEALLAGLGRDERQALAGLLRVLLAPFDARAQQGNNKPHADGRTAGDSRTDGGNGPHGENRSGGDSGPCAGNGPHGDGRSPADRGWADHRRALGRAGNPDR